MFRITRAALPILIAVLLLNHGAALAQSKVTGPARGVLPVHLQSQIARTRAVCERFSAMAEDRETGWWMTQSDANCSPASNSLIIREDTGNFRDFGCIGVELGPNKPCLLLGFVEILYPTEQGIFSM